MKESEARRILKRAKWKRERFGKGRHEIWRSADGGYITLTSKAKGRSIDRNLRVKLKKLKPADLEAE